MDFSAMISSFFGAIKEVFGFASKKTDLNNTPEMKKAQTAQKENDQKDQNDDIIKLGNVDDARGRLSE